MSNFDNLISYKEKKKHHSRRFGEKSRCFNKIMVKESQLQSAAVSYIITRTGLSSQPASMRGPGYD